MVDHETPGPDAQNPASAASQRASSAPNPPQIDAPRDVLASLRAAQAELARVVVGHSDITDNLFACVIAGGHCLLEGVPGTAKTLAVRTLATVLGGSFARLQFTPDLVPADIVGTRVYRQGAEEFATQLGPVFVQFVLADEINRAPAKVQAAMLELMAERQVSLGGTTHPLPEPFVVVATQNPVESEGVYALPEAQRDRFLMRLIVPLPSYEEEQEILARMSVDPPSARPILTPDAVLAIQKVAAHLFCHRHVADYAVRLVMATRDPHAFAGGAGAGLLASGVSSRATLGLLAAARARALLHGRDYVLPADVRSLAEPVLAHRLLLTFDALADGVDAGQVVRDIVAAVPEPRERPGDSHDPSADATAPGDGGPGDAAGPLAEMFERPA